ncbi:DUF1501 domain-containing protein [Chiayiivirga flava]|uniref:Uncharacterized protein (DUF1501 family) n=1 Tax=Chiayiivirga flava TaxID=659595 RepID=A0A7W8FXY8_9GAMM|nr:DUF1501 domain-containing protein [Chiayiivirga flava]MBB5206827.1 uncharacterized protein (DUF1501 family) [Chiayiivirga flava]
MSSIRTMLSRRTFLRRSLVAAAGGAGFFIAPQSLSLLNAAWAQQTPRGDDYKALVCVFLLGGNDGYNLVVPRSTAEYAVYADRRRGLTIPSAQLLPIEPLSGATHALGLHPALGEMRDLFQQRRLSVLANVGALLEPVSRSAYDNRSARLPPQLFSHNDQQDFWQTLEARSPVDSTPMSGWAGRAADLLHAGYNPDATIAMNLSLAGANPFLAGRASQALAVGTGAISSLVTEHDDDAALRLEALLAQSHPNLLVEQYRRTLQGAVGDYRTLQSALADASPLATAFPPPPAEGAPAADRFAFVLGSQLRRAAELISLRQTFGHRRQIFFTALGGFDTHDSQSRDQPELLAGLSRALGAFHAATVELGVESEVTTFTSSEFGRSLTSNGDGSDHAWGNHLFVFGGAVDGGRIVGEMPDLSAASPVIAGDGNLIPQISVDQYGATLARWFGVQDETALDVLFPSLANFDTRDLGFML